MEKKKKSTISFLNEKLHTPIWLFILLLGVLILRIPSFFEPYSYGDEMIYLTLGEAVRRGIPLYSQVHDNKPPLLYIIAAIAGSLFWFKAILAAWMLTTIFIFWKLTEVLYPKNIRLQKVATIAFALLTTLPLLEGNIVNAEVFMIGPTILAFYVLISKALTPKRLFISGILLSASTLFKVPALFDVPTIIIFWLVSIKKLNSNTFGKITKSTLYLLAGFFLPILITFVWYFLNGALNEYIKAAFLQNIGYLSSFRPGDVQKPFLNRNAPLLFRGLILSFSIGLLYFYRKKISKEFIFTTAWLMFTLFAVTLSERPYPHYLIQSVAPISILIGIFAAHKNIEQVIAIIPLTLTYFVPVYYHFWHYPTASYYVRFINFASGKISQEEYLKSFGDNVIRNYKISNFLATSSKSDEKIFVWGDSSVIYALSRRMPPIKYVADYHIKDFSTNDEVINTLTSNLPGFIAILPDSPPFPELSLLLNKNYALTSEFDGAKIWKLLSPKVRSLISS